MQTFLNTVGGRRVASASGRVFESFDPYTGKPWATIPRCNAEDVDAAVPARVRRSTAPPGAG